MSYIRPIFLIAGNTITGVLRGVVLNVLLVLGALLIILALFSGAMDPGKLGPTIIDTGLAVITLLGAVIAVLTGFTMIPGEVEHRTVYPVLSKPVRRWQFVLGKYFGALGINSITVALLSILFFIAYYLKLHQFDTRLLVAVLMIFAMLCVLSALIIFFSTFMSWIGTIIASFVIWFVGSYSQFLSDLAGAESGNRFSNIAFEIVQKLLPNFQAMDLRYAIVNDNISSFVANYQIVMVPLGAGLLYVAIALALATLIFNYREL